TQAAKSPEFHLYFQVASLGSGNRGFCPGKAAGRRMGRRRIVAASDRSAERRLPMSVQDVSFDRGVTWPSNGISEVPFRLYADPEQYRLEQERLFKGPAWNYLCLAGEIPNPGDWVATTLGEVAIIVARDADGEIG